MTENERLRLIQESLSITQEQMANRLNIKQGSISDIMRGRSTVSDSVKLKLMRHLGVNIDWLETGEGEMINSTNTNNVNVKGNGNTSVAGVGNQITTANLTEMIELQKGYQEMLKTSQEQITKLIELINEKLK